MKKLLLILFIPFVSFGQVCLKTDINEKFKLINENNFIDATASGLIINVGWDKNKTINWLKELSNNNAKLYIPIDKKGLLNWNSNLIITSGDNIFDVLNDKVGRSLCKHYLEIKESNIKVLNCNFKLVERSNLQYLEITTKAKTLWNNQLLYSKQFLINCNGKKFFMTLKTEESTISLDEILHIN